MADVTIKTFDVSVRGDVTGNYGEVNIDNEQLVHDQDAIDQLETIASGTTIIEQSVTTGWQYLCEQNQGFVTTFSATLGGGAGEKFFVLLENPASSGVYCRIKKINFGVQSSQTAATFRLYKDIGTVQSLGNALAISNFRDNAVTGAVNAYSEPNIQGAEMGEVFEAFDLNSAGVGALDIDQELALIVLEGEYLLLTIEQFNNNKAFSCNLSWGEETIPV
ncbi:MAG: hypothetical protein KAJ75_00100 [Alphaproteobacteria bacterium]|nr:hypothetical protein [Alphaproteobacteria bacterium]